MSIRPSIVIFLLMLNALVFSEGQGEVPHTGRKHAVMGSSGLGSSWYPTASRISAVCMKYTSTVIAVQSSEGGYENINLMRDRKFDLGIAESNITAYGYQGIRQFKGRPYTGMRFVTSLYPVVFQAVVQSDSGINTIYSLKNRTFSSSTPGFGKDGGWQDIFISGFRFSSDEIKWSPYSSEDRAIAFRDRFIDAIGFEGTCPSGSVLETSAQFPVKILSVGGGERKALMESCGWFRPWTIQAGTYINQGAEIETVAVDGVIVADSSVDEAVVYDLVSTIYGVGLDMIKSVHQMSGYISLENALSGEGAVPLHPGAERFYREKGLIK